MKTKAPRTIMVIDDELPIQRVLARLLKNPSRAIIAAEDGVAALALASERKIDLILLDVNMPKKNGWEVLSELRRRPNTRMTPVIMLTSASTVNDQVEGLALGADDYITKPFEALELRARVEGLLRRHEQILAANPLTGLPGNPAIEEEVTRLLTKKEPFAFFYIDIDRFKAFNDAYGFSEGDRFLVMTAALIRTSFGDRFVGHVGGDDFVAICGIEAAPYAAQRLACLFDERAPEFGCAARRPPTLSIGIVTNQRRAFTDYAEVAEVASEMKAYLKSETGRTLSRFAFDRRLSSKGE